MTRSKLRTETPDWKALLADDADLMREIVRAAVTEILEVEMTEALGAERGERTEGRLGYRAGYYQRSLVTRVGKLELRVPRDRDGRFSTQLFERYSRSEKALVGALAEMYVQGVSTRKVKAITEELCGHSFSASAISRINATLDESLAEFAGRRLEEPYPYLICDARYERVREGGVIRSQAILVAIGVNCDGYRCVLGVEAAPRESTTSWRDFLLGLRERGLAGVELVVSDDHPGLRRGIAEVLPEAAWLARWQATYPGLCDWAEENIAETLTFYRLPREHHKHLKSTNMLERFNEEIRRRTRVVRIFPNRESCLRLIRALAVETHEGWLEEHRYLNMALLAEQKKELMRMIEQAA